jgi:hypothetical protein
VYSQLWVLLDPMSSSQLLTTLTTTFDDIGIIVPRELITLIITYVRRQPCMILVGQHPSPSPTEWSTNTPTFITITVPRAPPATTLQQLQPRVPMAQLSISHPTMDHTIDWRAGASGIIDDFMYCTFRENVCRYHLDTGAVSINLRPMHVARRYPASVVINNRFYVACKYFIYLRIYVNEFGYVAGESTKSCEWYDPVVNRWTYGPSLNKHSSGGAVTLNNRIFVCGGVDPGVHNASMPMCLFFCLSSTLFVNIIMNRSNM